MSGLAHAKSNSSSQQVLPQMDKQEEQELVMPTTHSLWGTDGEDAPLDRAGGGNVQAQLNQAAVFGHSFGQLGAANNSLPPMQLKQSEGKLVTQLKSNHSGPIQKQGYGYEDEEQMMSVWHNDSAGTTSPDAPMSVPVPSTSSSSDTESYSKQWTGMTSPDEPMSVAVPTRASNATTYSSSNSEDLSSSSTNSSEDSPLWKKYLSQSIDVASGAASLFENAKPLAINMPNFKDYMFRVGGMRGWDTALTLEDAISYPGKRFPGVFGDSGNIVGSRLPGGMSRVSAALAPLGMVTGSSEMYDAWNENRYLDMAMAVPGLFSSTVGTTALAGSGLSAAGSSGLLAGTSIGTALSGVGGRIASATATPLLAKATAAPLLAKAAAVAAAFAGGYGVGKLLDQTTGGVMNITGLSDLLDQQRGITRPEGQHGDYSLSGITTNKMVEKDQEFSPMVLSMLGLYDETKPAYTQTIGWKLADKLGI